MTYNGWKNYETWTINLWLSNDPATDATVTDMVQEYHDQGVSAFADALKDYVEELIELEAGEHIFEGFVGQLVGAALSEVDWYELASTYDRDRYEPGDEEEEAESDEE